MTASPLPLSPGPGVTLPDRIRPGARTTTHPIDPREEPMGLIKNLLSDPVQRQLYQEDQKVYDRIVSGQIRGADAVDAALTEVRRRVLAPENKDQG